MVTYLLDRLPLLQRSSAGSVSVIRLVDANKPAAIATGEATFTDLYAEYGVRCTVTAVMRMRAKTCNDPVFPIMEWTNRSIVPT